MDSKHTTEGVAYCSGRLVQALFIGESALRAKGILPAWWQLDPAPAPPLARPFYIISTSRFFCRKPPSPQWATPPIYKSTIFLHFALDAFLFRPYTDVFLGYITC